MDSSDAAQDVLVVVWRRLTSIRQPERFAAWLFGITRRVVSQHRRRAWLRHHVLADTDRWTAAEECRPDARAAARERAAAVHAILDRLPRIHREVLVLCDVEGRTSEEASQILDIPSPTVRSRLRLARRRFQREAGEHAPELIQEESP